jgi:hypothetical protein
MHDGKDKLDFIVIGAQKAGTTSLFEYLKRHPEVCLPLDKEAPYFSHDPEIARGWDHYVKKTFASADPAKRWGTITTHYMVGGVYDRSGSPPDVVGSYDEQTVPLRIYAHLPGVRLIAILRDPVERARSHHLMAAMNGRERRPFDQAIDELLSPASLTSSRRSPEENTGYITWGEYGRILAGYMSVFPREQLLVVFSEELKNTPDLLVRRVHEFLGVATDQVPDNLGRKYREGNRSRRLSWLRPDALQAAVSGNGAARATWHALPPGARRQADRGFARMEYLVDLWNQRGGAPVEEPQPATLARLRRHFEQDTEMLAEVTGVAPPWIDVTGAK